MPRALRVDPVRVGAEENERSERGRADRVALRDGLRRVADRVERIGDRAHLRRQVRHLGDAARVVGDRPVRVERDDQAGHRELRHDGDADAVEARDVIRDQDAGGDDDHRQRCRLHADGEAFDDVRRVAGLRRLRDRLHGIPARAGVVLGDADEQERDGEPDELGDVQVPEAEPAARAETERDRDEAERAQDRRDEHAAVERIHHVAAFTHAREHRADDRRENREAADREREEPEMLAGRCSAAGDAEQHHGDRSDRVRLEQVGGHAGAVADVVADVVGDHGRVARVVLRDSRLELADEVGADVGRLREDAAAETREDRDERAAERETEQVLDRRVRRVAEPVRQRPVVAGDAEQAEADDEEPGDRARAERDVERRREARAGSLGRADVRAHGDVHADEAGRRRERRADQEADGRSPPELVVEAEQQERHDRDAGDRDVLPAQIRRGAFLHGARDLLHALRAGGLVENPLREAEPVGDGRTRANQREQNCMVRKPTHLVRAPLDRVRVTKSAPG